MSGRVKNLLLGKRDPSSQKTSNEDKKRNRDPSEPPQSPRTPRSPGFQIHQFQDLHPPPASPSPSPHPPRTSSSQHSNTSSTMSPPPMAVETIPPIMPVPGRRIDTEPPAMPITEERRARERSTSKASRDSPRTDADSPPKPTRPSPSRSSSQEGNFMNKVKASRQAAQAYGGKAAKITAKATSTTAKALGEKGSKAWDKIKTKAKSSKESASIVPQSQYLSNFKPGRRPKKPPIDVWGMSLKEATLKTRVVKEITSEADSAAYWTPAVAFRCLQYLNEYGPQELGLYRVSGSTAVVDELRADFIHSHDVDISLNPPNDIHTVTSLLKGYFRALPEAILPPDVQKRVYEQCKDYPESEKPPQCFIDELSQLAPYNYYMLYSLSAHLSNVNRQSDVNKMNLSNLGMIFCSTLRLDRFCFNWLVGHWGDCWQGCWTEREELERTDPALARIRAGLSPNLLSSPALTFDTRSSAPSSPAPSTTAPNTPAPPSIASQDTPSHSPIIKQSPIPSSLHRSLSKRADTPAGSVSVPPTPRTPSAPPTPFTPASFSMGDDQRMMVHRASEIIEDYINSDDKDHKGKQKVMQGETIEEKPEPLENNNAATSGPKQLQRALPETPLKETKEEVLATKAEEENTTKAEKKQLPELKLEVVSPTEETPKMTVPKIDSPKASSSKQGKSPPPAPLNLDGPSKSTLPVPLQLVLPPLTPISPLIATMDQKTGA